MNSHQDNLRRDLAYTTYTLDNGLRILYQPEDTPVTYIGFAISVGAAHDPQRYQGMAHLVEHMLFKGTHLRKGRKLINRLEEVGIDLNAYTTKEDTFLYASLPARYWQRAIQSMLDILLNSAFEPEELMREKQVITEEINSYRDSPGELIFDDFENLLFHGTPIGHNILGTEESVARITRQAALRFMAQHYRPERMVLCIRGSVKIEWVLGTVDRAFAQHMINEPPLVSSEIAPPPSDLAPLKPNVTRRIDSYQVHRAIGNYAYSLYDANRLPLSLLTNLLGGPSLNASLNIALREEAGLVYSVDGNYTPYARTGVFSIYFGTSLRHLEEAHKRVLDVLASCRLSPISDGDLARSKRQFIAQLLVADDNREHVFLSMMKSFLYYNHVLTHQQVVDRINALTSEQLQAVAQEVFAPERLLTLTYR